MSINSHKLSGKVAIVTGASKGIGASIAKHLASEGACVVVNYATSREGADKVVVDITAAGGKAIAVQANVAKKTEIERLFAESKKAFGQLDILVNNAGIYEAAPLGQITEEHFHGLFNLNVLGLILTTQEALNHFGPEGGSIINLSSIVSTSSPIGTAVYNATKSAVDGLTRTFAKELGKRRIRVNSINPGPIETEGTHTTGFIDRFQPIAAIIPFGRIGQPQDSAPAVVFLASFDSGVDDWRNALRHGRTSLSYPGCFAVGIDSKLGERSEVLVILPEQHQDAGLSGEAGKEVLVPFPANRMKAWPIDARVNSPENNDPEIIVPIEQHEKISQADNGEFRFD